jgi:hypothetical protein
MIEATLTGLREMPLPETRNASLDLRRLRRSRICEAESTPRSASKAIPPEKETRCLSGHPLAFGEMPNDAAQKAGKAA